MNVSELIQALLRCPQNAQISLCIDNCYWTLDERMPIEVLDDRVVSLVAAEADEDGAT